MRRVFVLAIWLFTNLCVYSQVDVLKFDHNQFVEGEIKGMENGIITIETSFSDDDFTIDWNEVKGIITERKFLMELTDGTKYYGVLRSRNEKEIIVINSDGKKQVVELLNVFKLHSIDEKILDRLSATIDIGFDLTKSFLSLTTSVSADYEEETWNSNLTYSNLHSKQSDAKEISRIEGKLSFNYFLGPNWYPNAMLQWLSNSEMQLDLRQNTQFGLGLYLYRTNKIYWGIKFGLNNNHECYYIYEDTEPDVKLYNYSNSWEIFIGTEANFFNTGDFSFYGLLTTYSNISQEGRWRTDFQLNCKYDLPLDFYIKTSVSFNQDNRSPAGISDIDYVFNTGFGWEW